MVNVYDYAVARAINDVVIGRLLVSVDSHCNINFLGPSTRTKINLSCNDGKCQFWYNGDKQVIFYADPDLFEKLRKL